MVSTSAAHVLFVEDDLITRRIVEECLRQEAIRISSVGAISAARATLLREAVDLVLLDLTLPDGDGVAFCRELRQKNRVPIVMLTARGEIDDTVEGLQAGADDYISKPFSPQLLVARVRAHLRRAELGRTPSDERIKLGEVMVDPAERRLEVRGESVTLATKEFDLFLLLARSRGRIVHRDVIFEAMWPEGERSEKILNVYIRRIREKIETKPAQPGILLTVRGVGYRLAT